MLRLRFLAGLLGCLAVLAAGLPVTALASVPSAKAMQTAASEPCQHCADCDGVPCQTAMANCVLACVTASPGLAASTSALPAISHDKVLWFASPAVLHGLTRPPDPFPPRS